VESEAQKEIHKGIIDATFLTDVIGTDPTPRGRVADWVRLKASVPGITLSQIAERLSVSRHTLNGYISKGVREGWLLLDDPLERVEHELKPMVVDNLKHFLKLKDKTVTIEAAKGTIFKEYQAEKGISDAPQTVLAIKFENIEDVPKIRNVSGSVVGKPKGLED
jgi:transposase